MRKVIILSAAALLFAGCTIADYTVGKTVLIAPKAGEKMVAVQASARTICKKHAFSERCETWLDVQQVQPQQEVKK